MDSAIIEKEALLLPDSQRALLADRLLESISVVPIELKEEWIRELDSRMDAYQRGEIEAVDGPAAMAELRSRFNV